MKACHQLAVFQRCPSRPRTRVADRLLWAWLSRPCSGWRNALVFVKPSTVIAWQRRMFRDYWARLSRARPTDPGWPRRSGTSSARCRAQTRPGALRLAYVHLLQGRLAEAVELFKNPIVPQSATCDWATALHTLGRHEEAAAVAKDVEARSAPWVATCLGYTYAWFGDRDRAFAIFERAIDERDPFVAWGIKSSRVLLQLHDDPRWKPLLRRMNLPVE